MAHDYILHSDFDKETGVSTVVLQTKWGTFKETSTCHAEDADVMNRWDGCAFAHYKCVVDKYAAKARAFHERALGMEHAANVLCQVRNMTKTWNVVEDSILQVRCLAEDAESEAKRYREKANQMRADYQDFCASTLAAHRDFRKNAAGRFENVIKGAIKDN